MNDTHTSFEDDGHDDEAVLRTLRRLTKPSARTSRTAVAALGLACFVFGASARDFASAVFTPEVEPYYRTHEWRSRCGVLKDEDGTLLEVAPIPTDREGRPLAR